MNITDLNPNKVYRIHMAGGNAGVDCGILRLSAPSFDGKVIQVLVPEGTWSRTPFPFDSLLLPGVESLSIDAAGGAASVINYEVSFEEYGPWKKGQVINRGSGGSRGTGTRDTAKMGGGSKFDMASFIKG